MSAKVAGLKDRLRAFVVANTRAGGVGCSTCKMDPEVLALIGKERQAGASLSVLARGLRKEGFAVSEGGLQRHFREHEKRQG